MSRRAAPSAAQERAATNQQSIKSLLKLEGNKACADCKRNKHPRWASWNLGIFICIRCSGIHRGMGTHISRVKSVDLDAWTDEQLQSVTRWGNMRANRYWEDKLAPGHVPSDAKIENFIRTKYESRRWVMEGGIPDPATLVESGVAPATASTLRESDDNVPLSIVQEKARLERAGSQKITGSGTGSSNNHGLLGDLSPPPPRPSTVQPNIRGPAQPLGTQMSGHSRGAYTSDSLLGLDSNLPARSSPSSLDTLSSPAGGTKKPDFKQSILSLYASAPKPQSATSAASLESRSGIDDLASLSPPMGSSTSQSAGLDQAFNGLSVTTKPNNVEASKPSGGSQTSGPTNGLDIFGDFSSTNESGAKSSTGVQQFGSGSKSSSKPFDISSMEPTVTSRPAQTTAPRINLKPIEASNFADFTAPASSRSQPTSTLPSSSNLDLFSVESKRPEEPKASSTTTAPSSSMDRSLFMLTSKPQSSTSSTNVQRGVAGSTAMSSSNRNPISSTTSAGVGSMMNSDAWGSSDAWSTPDPEPINTTSTMSSMPMPSQKASPPKQSNLDSVNDFSAWASAAEPTPFEKQVDSIPSFSGTNSVNRSNPSKAAMASILPSSHISMPAIDDEFGGWNSAAPENATTADFASNPVQPDTSARNANDGRAISADIAGLRGNSAGAGAGTAGGAPSFGASEDLFSNVWE